MREAYFENIQGIGGLALEYVFYEYEEPILFSCTDSRGGRYLCACCRLSENWLIGRVSNQQLIDMMEKKTTLADVFRCP